MMNQGGGESEDERPSSALRGPRDPRNSARRSATTPTPVETVPSSYRRSDQPSSSYPQRPASQNTTRRSLPQTPQRSSSVPFGKQPQQSAYDSDDSDDIYVKDDDDDGPRGAEGPSFPKPHSHSHGENQLHIPMTMPMPASMPMPTRSTLAPAFPSPQVHGSGVSSIAMPRPVSFTTDSELAEYQDAHSEFSDNAPGQAESGSGQFKSAFPSPWEAHQGQKPDPERTNHSPPPSSFPEPQIRGRNDSFGQPISPGRPSGPRHSLDHQSGPKHIVIRPMPTPPPTFPSAASTSPSPRRPSFGTNNTPGRHYNLSEDGDGQNFAEPEEMPTPAPTAPSMPTPPRYGPVRPAGRVHTLPKSGEPPRRSSTDKPRRPSMDAGSQQMSMPVAQNVHMPVPSGSSQVGASGPSKLPIHLPPLPTIPAPMPNTSGISRPPSSTSHGKPYSTPATFPSSSNLNEPKPITNVLPASTTQTVYNHNQFVDSLQNTHNKPSGSASSQSVQQQQQYLVHHPQPQQHHHNPPPRPSGSSSTGHGQNYPTPARPGTVHTMSTAHSQASPPPSRPPTTIAPSTTSTAAHPTKPPSSVSASTASKPPTRPTTDYSTTPSQHAPPPIKPNNSNNGKPVAPVSKPPPPASHPAPAIQHAQSNHNANNNNSNNNNAHHPTAAASQSDPPVPSRPHLFGGTSQMDTQYVSMLLALDDIPYYYNLGANFFTWILLAGFILFPGTFTNLQAAAASNNLPVNSPIVVDIVNGITELPLFIVAWVCTGVGIAGMMWLTWRWRKNYIWALNKIFVPGLLNSLAGLVSTLASIFGAQNGQLSSTSRITVIVLAASTGTFLILVGFYSLWLVRRIKAKHDKQVGHSVTGKYGEGGVDLSKRKNK